MSKPDLIQQFNNTLKKKFGSSFTKKFALRKWDKLQNTIYNTALDMFGKKTSKKCDWLDSKATVMMPAIEDNCSAHLQYIDLQTQKIYRLLKMRTNSGLYSAKKFNMLQTQEIFATASKKLWDQSRERRVL